MRPPVPIEYVTNEGDPFYVDVETDECPRSILSRGAGLRARELTGQILQHMRVHKASGAVFGGSDSSQWPARYFQAVAAIEQAKITEHNARIETENEAIRRKNHG